MTEQSSSRSWIVASTLGLAVGIPAGALLGAPLEVVVGMMVITPLMLGLIGLFVGGSQSVALQPRIAGRASWIGLTALGFALGFTVSLVLVEEGGQWLTGAPVRMSSTGTLGLAIAFLVIGTIGGTTVGAAQSVAMRHLSGARRAWIVASAAGLTLGFLGGLALATAVGGVTSPLGLAVFLAVSALIYSATTGRALGRLRPAA